MNEIRIYLSCIYFSECKKNLKKLLTNAICNDIIIKLSDENRKQTDIKKISKNFEKKY